MNGPGTGGPQRLALLPSPQAAKFLTQGVRSGQEHLQQVPILRASQEIEETSARWEAAPLRRLLDEAMLRFDDNHTGADAWLAPRLHATLRLTRAEATQAELWNFLALAVASDYVLWRHLAPGVDKEGNTRKASGARFTGPQYTQAFARLWWAAELFRDGEDYRPAEIACGNQDVLNTVLRLDAIDHKPTALAITRVLDGLTTSGASRLGDRVNALSTAVNTAGSTLVYEVLSPHELPDLDALLYWIAEADNAPAVPWERLPDGPPDGRARKASVETLAEMFGKLLGEVPLRDRSKKGGADGLD